MFNKLIEIITTAYERAEYHGKLIPKVDDLEIWVCRYEGSPEIKCHTTVIRRGMGGFTV